MTLRSMHWHLSSTIVLMFVAALLLFANATPHRSGEIITFGMRSYQNRGYGWPFLFHVTDCVDQHEQSYPAGLRPREFVIHVTIDCFANLGVLGICALLFARVPRRRGKQPAGSVSPPHT